MILCSGVFDGLHLGHVTYLSEACVLGHPGEMLMVAVAPDAYVQRHKDRSPQWPAEARMSVVLCLGLVDRVVLHGAESVADVIAEYQPRLFVKGADWQDHLPEDVVRACQQVGCEIRYVNSGVTQHSSDALPTRC